MYPDLSKLFFPYLKKLDRIVSTRGLSGLIAYNKQIRQKFLLALSSGSVDLDKGITGNSLPKDLRVLVDKLLSLKVPPVLILRLLTTLVYFTRALKTGRTENISSIVQPSSMKVPELLDKYSSDFWKSLGYHRINKVPNSLKWKSFHQTSKSGPNGHALGSCLADLFCLPLKLVESLKLFGGERFSSRIQTCLEAAKVGYFWSVPRFETFFKIKGSSFRRLISFPDKEDKVRVVAILDYWSQTVLRPLHFYLYRALRKIPQDCTFDQGKFKDFLGKGDVKYYSVDLTACTDRFPIEFIGKVLGSHLPTYYIDLWKDIMIGYPFDYKTARGLKKVSYSVGTPMGAYSSWASMALVHHYVVYLCCRELNLNWRLLPYALLGDDIVISNEAVGERYITVIRSLGIEISEVKTHKSYHLIEFSKRLLYKGQEITPFPFAGLYTGRRRYNLLTSLLVQAEKKEWVTENIALAVSKLYECTSNLPGRVRSRLKDSSYLYEQVLRACEEGAVYDAINGIIKYFNFDIRELNSKECLALLENITVECFAESDVTDDGRSTPSNREPLGVLSEELVIYFLQSDEILRQQFGSSLIESFPPLPIYGQWCERYLKTRDEAYRLDTTPGASWINFIRNWSFPSGDSMLYSRNTETPIPSVTISKRILQRLEVIKQYPNL